jgi:hypothetical protein
MRLISLLVVLVCALAACNDRPSPMEATEAVPLRVSQAQGRPTEQDFSFTGQGFCAFDILFHYTGKAKFIALPGNRSIVTSPGLVVTLTNLDNQNQETFGITGAFHQDTLSNGNLVTVVTGRNLLFDPLAGFVLAIGRFSFAFDATGTLIQPLQGKGKLTDLCKLLS